MPVLEHFHSMWHLVADEAKEVFCEEGKSDDTALPKLLYRALGRGSLGNHDGQMEGANRLKVQKD
jgi:hypothetical protein